MDKTMIKIEDINGIIEKRNCKYTEYQIKKIAYDYDCIIKSINLKTISTLKGNSNGLLIFISEII